MDFEDMKLCLEKISEEVQYLYERIEELEKTFNR